MTHWKRGVRQPSVKDFPDGIVYGYYCRKRGRGCKSLDQGVWVRETEVKATEFAQDGAESKLTGGLEGVFEALRRAKIPGSGVIGRFLAS